MWYRFGEYLGIIIQPILLCIITWRYGDWRNWKKYYPTIIFAIVVEAISSHLTYNHFLWHIHKALIFPNHTMVSIYMDFVYFPMIFILFLSRYPYKSSWLKQLGWISFWCALWSLEELLFLKFEIITYENGWNYWHSVFVWFSMFIIIRIHHTKPLMAWLLSLIYMIYVFHHFDLSIYFLK